MPNQRTYFAYYGANLQNRPQSSSHFTMLMSSLSDFLTIWREKEIDVLPDVTRSNFFHHIFPLFYGSLFRRLVQGLRSCLEASVSPGQLFNRDILDDAYSLILSTFVFVLSVWAFTDTRHTIHFFVIQSFWMA